MWTIAPPSPKLSLVTKLQPSIIDWLFISQYAPPAEAATFSEKVESVTKTAAYCAATAPPYPRAALFSKTQLFKINDGYSGALSAGGLMMHTPPPAIR